MKKNTFFAVSMIVLAGFFASTATVLAALEKAPGLRAAIKLTGSDTDIRERADSQIDRRVDDLEKLDSRLAEMKRLSDSVRASLNTTVDTEINALLALKTKLASQTGESLKTDAKTITSGYRVYMLVIPQIRLLAASDRATTTANLLTTLAGKFQVRIAALQADGKDVGNLPATLSDMNTKIAEAKAAAAEVTALVATLTADQKDTAKIEANQKALTNARAKIKIAESALKAAHKDAKEISALLKVGKNAE